MMLSQLDLPEDEYLYWALNELPPGWDSRRAYESWAIH